MVCVQYGVWGNKIATNVKLHSMHESSMDIGYISWDITAAGVWMRDIAGHAP